MSGAKKDIENLQVNTDDMTALRCTQKLLTAMRAKPAAPPPPGGNALGDWSLNLLHVRPRKLVLAISEHDRFALVLEAAPYASLLQRLIDTLFTQLLFIGVPPDAARCECEAMRPLTITSTTHYPDRRSIQANMTDYALVVEYMLEQQSGSLAAINVQLTKHLVGIKGEYQRPRERVFAALAGRTGKPDSF